MRRVLLLVVILAGCSRRERPKNVEAEAASAPEVARQSALVPAPGGIPPIAPVPGVSVEPSRQGIGSNIGWSNSPFDLSAERLPPGFVGQDPEYIWSAVIEKLGPKGEFETTKQYQERLRSALEKPLLGALTVNDVFASTTDESHANRDGKAEVLYDADRAVLTIRAGLEGLPDGLKTSSEGSDAMTVKTVGDYWGGDAYIYLVVGRLQYGALEAPMDAQTAKAAKPNLRILLLYRLVSPFSQEYMRRYFPTTGKMMEHRQRYLYASVEQIWLYNVETGEVYRKLKLDRSAPKPDPQPKAAEEPRQHSSTDLLSTLRKSGVFDNDVEQEPRRGAEKAAEQHRQLAEQRKRTPPPSMSLPTR